MDMKKRIGLIVLSFTLILGGIVYAESTTPLGQAMTKMAASYLALQKDLTAGNTAQAVVDAKSMQANAAACLCIAPQDGDDMQALAKQECNVIAGTAQADAAQPCNVFLPSTVGSDPDKIKDFESRLCNLISQVGTLVDQVSAGNIADATTQIGVINTGKSDAHKLYKPPTPAQSGD
jgi:soluble cytochrome b562